MNKKFCAANADTLPTKANFWFKLAENVTHVNLPLTIARLGFTLAEGATHVDTPPTKVKLGFTLAEILITLGVIGVVAAMTIPTLMSAYNRHVVETRLYKIHSSFMQGIRMAQANSDSNFTVQNPTTGKEDVNGFSWENSKLVFDEYFAPVFKISHTYPKGTIFKVYSTDGQAQVNGAGDVNTYQIALLDGTVLGFTKFGGQNTRFYLDITINPTRKKLISGRDTFFIQYSDDGEGNFQIYNPYSTISNEKLKEYCTSHTYRPALAIYPSAFCTALIVKNNFKIPSDYPIKF